MIHRLLAVFLLLTLGGCLPKERFTWSPDGSQAAVIIDGKVHLTNSGGEIESGLQQKTLGPGSVTTEQVTWLPDGSGIIANQIRSIARWEEARPLLSRKDVGRIEILAQNMVALLTAQKTLQPDAKSIQAILSGMLPDEEEIAGNALLLAYQQQKGAIERALKETLPELKNTEEHLLTSSYTIHELILLKLSGGGSANGSRALVRDVRLIGGCKASPHFSEIAFARRNGSGLSVAIEIFSLDTNKRLEVASRAFAAFSWTIDGRSLVYMAPLSGSESTIKRIRKIEVLTKSGAQHTVSSLPKATVLATAVIPFLPRISVLPDGRMLFAAQAGEWPVQGAQPITSSRLFLLSQNGDLLKTVPTTEKDLPMNLGHFVPSPDGRSVAIVESDTDALVIVKLETGEMKLVSKPHPFWKCRTLPAWRNNNELTFAALGDSGQIDWMLHDTRGDFKNLSQSWPKESTAKWLEFKQPAVKE